MKIFLHFIALMFAIGAAPQAALAEVDYHFVGWANLFVPGLGETLLGRPVFGAFQTTYELGTFWTGYNLSGGSIFSLDGFISPKPTRTLRRGVELNMELQLMGDVLQEFGLKSHMVNTFEAYRQGARKKGALPDDMESKSVKDLFLEPFSAKNIVDPWVYVPIALVFGAAVADYTSQVSGTLPSVPRMNPTSNVLNGVNYGLWQPVGSGAPEEMFYRGFLQREFKHWTGSELAAITLSSALFAISHAPGAGRNSAAIAGAYLGYLAERNHGRLGPGITVHFWSSIILGLETILLSSKSQRATAPASMNVQINF